MITILANRGINWNIEDAINTPYGFTDKDVTSDYLTIVNARNLYFYHQLSDESKARAIVNVILSEIDNIQKHMIKQKEQIKDNVHWCINERNFLKRTRNALSALRKMRKNDNHYITSYIEQNYCLFDKNGAHIHPYDYTVLSDHEPLIKKVQV